MALHTSQAMAVVAREKIVDSLPQSRQLTFKNWLAMENTSTVNKFEFLSTLARGVVGLARFRAAVEDVHTLGWLFSPIGFGTRETAVPRHHTSESALTPAEFRRSLLFHTLDGVERVLTSRRAVSLDLTGTLHHVNT